MREFMEWAAFDHLKGIRMDRETFDILFANLCAFVIAPHTKSGKSKKLKDYMIWKPKEEKRVRSSKPIDPAKMQAWAQAFIAQQSAFGNVKKANG